VPYQIAKLGERHKTMAAFMLANPHLDYIEVADRLGWTKEWVGMVARSDMFRDYVSRLRDGMHEAVNHKIVHELGEMTVKSLGRIRERLAAGAISNRELIETADLGLRNMGYGPRSGPSIGAQPQLHLHVTSEDIRNASERIGQRNGRILDGSTVEEADAGSVPTPSRHSAEMGQGDLWPSEPAEQRPGQPFPGPRPSQP
jgi:hypothetical protein